MSNSFIFNPLDNIDNKAKEIKDKFYAFVDFCDYIDEQNYPRSTKENEKTLAKITVRKNGSIKYSIKTTNNGKMHNPICVYGDEKENNFLDRICRSNDRFKEVNHKVFNLYLNFLKTKNIAWFHNAEREDE